LVLAAGGATAIRGEVEEGLGLILEAEQLARSTGQADLELDAETLQSWAKLSLGELPDALETANRVLERLQLRTELRSTTGVKMHAQALHYRVWILTEMGRFREAAADLLEVPSGWLNSYLSACRGEADDALRNATRALDEAERRGNRNARVLALNSLGNAYALSGKWEAACGPLAEAVETAQSAGTTLNVEARLLANLADATLGAGDVGGARAIAEKGSQVGAQRRTRVGEGLAQLSLARSLLAPERNLHRRLAENALGRVDTLIGETAALILAPPLRVERAKMARLLGDEGTWAHELREAHRLYTAMGATGHAERLAQELEELRSR
jgi:tetratricopeptide (TPR) repeat protein